MPHWFFYVLVGLLLAVAVHADPDPGPAPDPNGGGSGSGGTTIEKAQVYETAYACEGKVLAIDCALGESINLIRANYGRFSITICNEHGNVDWSVNCMSDRSLHVLNTR